MAPDETTLNTLTQPFAMQVLFRRATKSMDAALILCAPGLSGNKKIPPRTILFSTTEGQMQNADKESKGIAYGWIDCGKAFVFEAAASLMTLKEYIKKTGATSVQKHEPFTQVIPTKLKVTASLAFVAKDPIAREFFSHAQRMQEVGVAWKVLTQGKVVKPLGVAIYTHKEMLMPVAGRLLIK